MKVKFEVDPEDLTLDRFVSFFHLLTGTHIAGVGPKKETGPKKIPRLLSAPKRKSRIFRHKGETCQDASLRLGGSPGLVAYRIRGGWDVEKAFNTPPQKQFRRKK